MVCIVEYRRSLSAVPCVFSASTSSSPTSRCSAVIQAHSAEVRMCGLFSEVGLPAAKGDPTIYLPR